MPKLHIDTDIGGDIDDLCALAMVLNWPGVDLRAVTTNSDDGGKRAGYARYALNLAGRAEVDVAAGADVSLGCYRVRPDLPDETMYWPEPVAAAPTPLDRALDLLERSIDEGAIVVAIGAYTNLMLLERRTPGILQRARLFLMGGSIFTPRPGFPQWGIDMDWNIQVDAEAARCVLENARPTLIPLSVTVETYLRRAHLDRLRQAGPLAQLIARQAEVFAVEYDNETQHGRTCAGLPDDIINFQHDPLACAIALGWRYGVEIEELPLRIELEGSFLYQSIAQDGAPMHAVTRVDGERFSSLWLEVVAGTVPHLLDL